MPFVNGNSILDVMVRRLKQNKRQIPVVIATTWESSDDIIVAIAEKHASMTYRGSTSDVLARLIGAAEQLKLDWVVRVCADNPFLHLGSVERLIDECQDHDFDYCSFEAWPGLPAIRSHLGLYAELVSIATLRTAAGLTEHLPDREHVTKYVYEHPNSFNLKWLMADKVVFNRSDLRFTVDDQVDFDLMQELYGKVVGDAWHFDMSQLVEYVDANSNYREIMKSQIARYTK